MAVIVMIDTWKIDMDDQGVMKEVTVVVEATGLMVVIVGITIATTIMTTTVVDVVVENALVVIRTTNVKNEGIANGVHLVIVLVIDRMIAVVVVEVLAAGVATKMKIRPVSHLIVEGAVASEIVKVAVVLLWVVTRIVMNENIAAAANAAVAPAVVVGVKVVAAVQSEVGKRRARNENLNLCFLVNYIKSIWS